MNALHSEYADSTGIIAISSKQLEQEALNLTEEEREASWQQTLLSPYYPSDVEHTAAA